MSTLAFVPGTSNSVLQVHSGWLYSFPSLLLSNDTPACAGLLPVRCASSCGACLISLLMDDMCSQLARSTLRSVPLPLQRLYVCCCCVHDTGTSTMSARLPSVSRSTVKHKNSACLRCPVLIIAHLFLAAVARVHECLASSQQRRQARAV